MKFASGPSDTFDKPDALAVIGTWDPFTEPHRKLFLEMAEHAARTGLTPVVVILHPSPVRLLNPHAKACLEYTDIYARALMIRASAAVRVLILKFLKRDLDASCKDLFRLLEMHIHLRELWLGATQSLGRGPQGSDIAISAHASEHDITLRRLPHAGDVVPGNSALKCVDNGKVKDAIRAAGGFSVWRRPRTGSLKIDWPEGEYVVAPVDAPHFTRISGQPQAVRLVPLNAEPGKRLLLWPDHNVPWLAFTAGPEDCFSAPKGKSTQSEGAVVKTSLPSASQPRT